MIKTRLPCDYERCIAETCDIRVACLRHTASIEKCARYSMSNGGHCVDNNHVYFLPNGIPKPEEKDEKQQD